MGFAELDPIKPDPTASLSKEGLWLYAVRACGGRSPGLGLGLNWAFSGPFYQPRHSPCFASGISKPGLFQ
jgi:hypothetical protein